MAFVLLQETFGQVALSEELLKAIFTLNPSGFWKEVTHDCLLRQFMYGNFFEMNRLSRDLQFKETVDSTIVLFAPIKAETDWHKEIALSIKDYPPVIFPQTKTNLFSK